MLSTTCRAFAAAVLVSVVCVNFGIAENSITSIDIEPIVITVPENTSGLVTIIDTKQPIQPIPVNDGASFLKVLPGFSVARKGGGSGDPVYRGLSGSRLNFILDGMEFLGGCGSRMDPPTAYIFPETYDSAKLIKGPQSVRYGNGNSAGVVSFERDTRQDEGASGLVSGTVGSWGRVDGLSVARYSTPSVDLEGSFSHAQSDNYHDGSGADVHSQYKRSSATALLGFRPTDGSHVKLDITRSDAEAAFSDRALDGSLFDRTSYGITGTIGGESDNLSLRVYSTYIDHVMDNFSLRQTTNCGSGTDNRCLLMNVDRRTNGLRASGTFTPTDMLVLRLGSDFKQDEHSSRNFMNRSLVAAEAFTSAARIKDFESQIRGFFSEVDIKLSDTLNMYGGLRQDHWQASRFQNVGNTQSLFLGGDVQNLNSGFLRIEISNVNDSVNAYVGYGLSERPMDYWEATSFNGIVANDVVNVQPEETAQWDLGFSMRGGSFSLNVSTYIADMNNYLLTVDEATDSVSNIQAHRYGAEVDIRYFLGEHWTLLGSTSYVRAENETRNTPLAQTPPLETVVGVNYAGSIWDFGVSMRYVNAQDRIDPGYGSVVGFDRQSATPSFKTIAVNSSVRIGPQFYMSAGIDNLLDENYFEHVSRSNAASITGFVTDSNVGVREPGRTFWLKSGFDF